MLEVEDARLDRRGAVRVPVRGVAVVYAGGRKRRGTIENLSRTGALIRVSGDDMDGDVDVELRVPGFVAGGERLFPWFADLGQYAVAAPGMEERDRRAVCTRPRHFVHHADAACLELSDALF